MKKFIFLSFLLVLSVFVYAQAPCNPPINLTGTVNTPNLYDVKLEWNYPAGTNAPDQWLSWFLSGTGGFITLKNIIMVHRYEPADLLAFNDKYLTKVMFFAEKDVPFSSGNEYIVNIYRGGSYVSGVGFTPGTLVYSQQVPADSVSGGITVILDSAIAIDATQEMCQPKCSVLCLWFVIRF